MHWLFNGGNLSTTENTEYSGGNVNTPLLTINNKASTDAGKYRCVATNPVRSTTSSQSVTVRFISDMRYLTALRQVTITA